MMNIKAPTVCRVVLARYIDKMSKPPVENPKRSAMPTPAPVSTPPKIAFISGLVDKAWTGNTMAKADTKNMVMKL